MKFRHLVVTAALAMGIAQSASALNIVLTNDDSWHTDNIQILFDKLEEAGHDVVMSAPCAEQSGKSGSMGAIAKPMPVDRSLISEDKACVGETDTSIAYEDFSEGTPVSAALYGIDVLAQEKWGQNPDLVISGPNTGNNLGAMTIHSGTLGATNVSIARGVPAIAVSAATSDADNAVLVADVVVDIVAELVKKQKEGEPVLPLFTGLNVNTPEDMVNHKGYKFTRVGWYAQYEMAFTDDLSSNDAIMGYVAQGLMAAGYAPDFETAMAMARGMYAGQAGLSVNIPENPLDTNEYSEGHAWEEGYITISTIEANVQASLLKTVIAQKKLKALVKGKKIKKRSVNMMKMMINN